MVCDDAISIQVKLEFKKNNTSLRVDIYLHTQNY